MTEHKTTVSAYGNYGRCTCGLEVKSDSDYSAKDKIGIHLDEVQKGIVA